MFRAAHLMSDTELSLQERYAPENRCFGCGPANARGLRIRSFPISEDPAGEVVADWTPAPHHLAFEGVLNGGIIGTLLDCHSNWTASWHLMRRDGLEQAPTTVTADFHVMLRRPTPTDQPVHLSARAIASEGRKVTVEASLSSGGVTTASCTGHFIAVGPDHPAHAAWQGARHHASDAGGPPAS
jgi:acyl-coenzyme A thioesterase PaaI-like protein